MVTIARNCALTILKKNKYETIEDVLEDHAQDYDLEAEVIAELSAQEIYALLGQLDESLRNIFLLKYAYDLSHAEIAAQLGITENNVTVKLHRTKKKLKDLLVGKEP